MPTLVHFIGVEEPVRLQESYDDVIANFHGSNLGVCYFGEEGSRVAMYKSALAYIEETSEPRVGSA